MRECPVFDAILLRVMCSFDPGRMAAPRITALHMLRSAAKDNLRSCEKGISGLNHTPHATAVYASRPALLTDSRNTRFRAAC